MADQKQTPMSELVDYVGDQIKSWEGHEDQELAAEHINRLQAIKGELEGRMKKGSKMYGSSRGKMED